MLWNSVTLRTDVKMETLLAMNNGLKNWEVTPEFSELLKQDSRSQTLHCIMEVLQIIGYFWEWSDMPMAAERTVQEGNRNDDMLSPSPLQSIIFLAKAPFLRHSSQIF